MKSKILITGSCGFLMGNFIRKVIYEKQPYQFVSLDKVSSNSINSVYWNKSHIFHIADITNQHIVDTIFQFEKPDIVIHAAAETPESPTYINSNIIGTQNVIKACVKHKIEKLIYISTNEVYDKTSKTEEDVINPSNSYAASKAAAELLVKAAFLEYGLNYNIIRMSGGYGPHQQADKFIPMIIKNIINKKKFSLIGDGLTLRAWTHIFDYCSGILTILNNGANNEIYSISSNQELTDIEVVQKICNVMSEGHDLLIQNGDQLKDNINYGLVDSTKIKQIGWEPKYKFKNGINLCVDWYCANKWIIR